MAYRRAVTLILCLAAVAGASRAQMTEPLAPQKAKELESAPGTCASISDRAACHLAAKDKGCAWHQKVKHQADGSPLLVFEGCVFAGAPERAAPPPDPCRSFLDEASCVSSGKERGCGWHRPEVARRSDGSEVTIVHAGCRRRLPSFDPEKIKALLDKSPPPRK